MKKSDIKILLVDDEPDIIEILRYNLTQEGYSVIAAKDGHSAIKKAEKEIPNLIIMDVMMPKMDGIEACGIIRQNPKFNDTIIMFLTARGEDYSHVAAYDAGADDYVTKPIKPKVFISKVKGLLRRLKKENNLTSIIEIGKLIIDNDEYKKRKNIKNKVATSSRSVYHCAAFLQVVFFLKKIFWIKLVYLMKVSQFVRIMTCG